MRTRDSFTTLDTHVSPSAGDPEPHVSLVVRWADGVRVVPLSANESVVIGRSHDCDLTIDDPTLSRQHARLQRVGARVRAEDLGSRNGISVAGQRCSKAVLEAGQWLSLGEVVVSVHVTGEPHASTLSSDDALWDQAGMGEVMQFVARAARSHLPLLIVGESGTGKELVAREAHRLSARASQPLLAVNCATITASIAESVLFGHERGAFTGADRTHQGLLEQADGGTLFLDEIGELSIETQAKLLRVLETGRLSRVGSAKEITVDLRVIAATHRDLESMVARGAFRLDLLHRLDVLRIAIPPLRERPAAIEPLLNHFLAACADGQAKRFTPEAIEVLRRYAWPGNVRELRNVVERCNAMADARVIALDDLPERLHPSSQHALSTTPSAPPPPAHASTSTTPSAPPSLRSQQEELERTVLLDALAQHSDRREAAQALGISLRTLERRIQKHGLGRGR